MLGPWAAMGAGRRDEDGVRTAVIVRAEDGSVGLSFMRFGGATAGPFVVTRLVPQSAAERSQAVEVGDHFRAVDGRDVTALDDAAVAGLFRGAPGTTLELLLCDGPPPPPPPGPLDDKEVASAMQWARSRKLPEPTMSDFEALLRLLQPMAIPLAEVCMQLPARLRHLQHGCSALTAHGPGRTGDARAGHRPRSQRLRDESKAAGQARCHQACQPQRAEASSPAVSLPLMPCCGCRRGAARVPW